MKLAVSNIAWPHADIEIAADCMIAEGITGVEIAPTMIWPDLTVVRDDDILAHRRFWNDRGIAVVGMQALFFGRPELTLFGSDQGQSMLHYLDIVMGIAARLGARSLVFGSPRNRRIGDLQPAAVQSAARTFFRRAGALAEQHGVVLCIEANPPEYGADFIVDTDEAAALVADVAHPGFALHLDLGGMVLNRQTPDELIRRYGPITRHFHVSEPRLEPLGQPTTPHHRVAAALRECAYSHWVSLETRHVPEDDTSHQLARALSLLRSVYGT